MAKQRGDSGRINPLGVIAVAFGAGVLGAFVFDLHSHKCESCGKSWRHLGKFNEGDAQAHSCPRCGKIQWVIAGREHHRPFPADDIPADSAPQPTLPPGPRR